MHNLLKAYKHTYFLVLPSMKGDELHFLPQKKKDISDLGFEISFCKKKNHEFLEKYDFCTAA